MSFKFSLKPVLLFLLVVISAISCKNDSELEDNIAKINTDIQIERFDRLFAEVTSENFAIIDSVKTQLTDHSIFLAFAPKDNPKIAIAVFVENGYWGSRFAGKVASLMIEKHIKGYTTRKDLEEWLLKHSLENEYAKPYSGKPFRINGYTTLQIVEEQEYYKLKEKLKTISNTPKQ